mgnify:CR=1 FL=1
MSVKEYLSVASFIWKDFYEILFEPYKFFQNLFSNTDNRYLIGCLFFLVFAKTTDIVLDSVVKNETLTVEAGLPNLLLFIIANLIYCLLVVSFIRLFRFRFDTQIVVVSLIYLGGLLCLVGSVLSVLFRGVQIVYLPDAHIEFEAFIKLLELDGSLVSDPGFKSDLKSFVFSNPAFYLFIALTSSVFFVVRLMYIRLLCKALITKYDQRKGALWSLILLMLSLSYLDDTLLKPLQASLGL